MRLPVSAGILLCCALVCGCARKAQEDPAATVRSVYTSIAASECKQQVDTNDPNETPFLACPGLAGYTLIVRRVDSGRKSLDVVDGNGRAHPLRLHEVVTRHMLTLEDRVEWRVAPKDGANVPVALIVRVRAREEGSEPEKVTRSWLAIAKLTPGEACVTDRVAEGSQSEAMVLQAADSAAGRPCAASLPPMVEGGIRIR